MLPRSLGRLTIPSSEPATNNNAGRKRQGWGFFVWLPATGFIDRQELDVKPKGIQRGRQVSCGHRVFVWGGAEGQGPKDTGENGAEAGLGGRVSQQSNRGGRMHQNGANGSKGEENIPGLTIYGEIEAKLG